jgi:hypothetical protein
MTFTFRPGKPTSCAVTESEKSNRIPVNAFTKVIGKPRRGATLFTSELPTDCGGILLLETENERV